MDPGSFGMECVASEPCSDEGSAELSTNVASDARYEYVPKSGLEPGLVVEEIHAPNGGETHGGHATTSAVATGHRGCLSRGPLCPTHRNFAASPSLQKLTGLSALRMVEQVRRTNVRHPGTGKRPCGHACSGFAIARNTGAIKNLARGPLPSARKYK